jgi:hypothetical protein
MHKIGERRDGGFLPDRGAAIRLRSQPAMYPFGAQSPR